MLFLVATPIGNLADFSFRGVETLKNVLYILAEDTRRTRILLSHYKISTPCKSYHSFNETKKLESILHDLEAGQKIALVSDAGMPLISDPGSKLVLTCHERNIPVTCIPGPSAPITLVSLSGYSEKPFQFVGFFPKKAKEQQELLKQMSSYKGASLFFESPFRLKKTVSLFPEGTYFVIGRELTKLHEELLRGDKNSILAEIKEIKGECVIFALVPEKKEILQQDALSNLKRDLLRHLSRTQVEKILHKIEKKTS